MATAKISRRLLAQTLATKLVAEPENRGKWLTAAAAYLVERRQTDRAEQLVQDIAREVHVQTGTLLASVTSAHELTESIRADLTDYLKKATQASTVVLDEHVDPSLLSGLVARTPDYELNTTARYRLRQLTSLEA
jgi:F0F1-type ATP synthase delta subunit